MSKRKKEKVFRRDDCMVYELGGDYFHCSFSIKEHGLSIILKDEKCLNSTIIQLGREKAQELNML